MDNEERLKPCPFCNGEARLFKHGIRDYWVIGCKRCFVVFPDSFSKQEAITKWNRRVKHEI